MKDKKGKSRATYDQITPKINNILDRFNLIRVDENLQYFQKSADLDSQLFPNNIKKSDVLYDLENIIQHLPPKFKKFIYLNNANKEIEYEQISYMRDCNSIKLPKLDFYQVRDAVKRYEQFRQWREILLSIIKRYNENPNFEVMLPELIQTNGHLIIRKTIERKREVFRIQFEEDEYKKAFDNLDIDRIRICKMCDYFFWAKRKDSITCSYPCSNAYQQKNYREEHKEEIKTQRKKRSQSLKEQKEGKLRKKLRGNDGTI